MELHIGIDDTDSTKGGCTTYIAARLVEKLSKLGAKFTDYPNIIRLNPNIPYKTRGNAAVSLRLNIPDELYDSVQEETIEEVEENTRLGTVGTDPAIVFLKGRPPLKIRNLSRKALIDVVSVQEAQEALTRCHVTGVTYGSSRLSWRLIGDRPRTRWRPHVRAGRLQGEKELGNAKARRPDVREENGSAYRTSNVQQL